MGNTVGNLRIHLPSSWREGGNVWGHPHPAPLPSREREDFFKEFKGWKKLRSLKSWSLAF